jgi:hypothetical protein
MNSEEKINTPAISNVTDSETPLTPEQFQLVSTLADLQRAETLGGRRANRRKVMVAATGYEANPLLTIPRNQTCPCRSGKKFKVCHLNKLPLYVTKASAEVYREAMKKPDLVFLTQENAEQLAEIAKGTTNGGGDGGALDRTFGEASP